MGGLDNPQYYNVHLLHQSRPAARRSDRKLENMKNVSIDEYRRQNAAAHAITAKAMPNTALAAITAWGDPAANTAQQTAAITNILEGMAALDIADYSIALTALRLQMLAGGISIAAQLDPALSA